jgi:hypothetical protein
VRVVEPPAVIGNDPITSAGRKQWPLRRATARTFQMTTLRRINADAIAPAIVADIAASV